VSIKTPFFTLRGLTVVKQGHFYKLKGKKWGKNPSNKVEQVTRLNEKSLHAGIYFINKLHVGNDAENRV
jgi:hypothetical protein